MVRSGMGINFYYVGLLFACAAYAGICGAAPERIGAAIIFAGAVLSAVAASAASVRYQGVEVGVFVVDVVTIAAFILLALRAERFWPIWVSAFLGVGALGHLAMALHVRVIPWAYAVVLTIWSYPILATVAIGTFNHRRRLKQFGTDPSWSSESAGLEPPPEPAI